MDTTVVSVRDAISLFLPPLRDAEMFRCSVFNED